MGILEDDTLADLPDLTPAQLEERLRALAQLARRLADENRALQERVVWLWQIRRRDEQTMAKALHGGPIQELSSLLFEINILQQTAQDEQSIETITILKDNLKSAISHLRKFIGELNSPALAHFGLQAALRSTVEEIQNEHNELRIALVIGIEDRLPDSHTEWILYRIFRHLLDNVVAHAQARNVIVRLRRDGGELELAVEDDGAGFDLPENWSTVLEPERAGLLAAKLQAEMLAGRFMIHSSPGEGTRAQVRIPFPGQARTS